MWEKRAKKIALFVSFFFNFVGFYFLQKLMKHVRECVLYCFLQAQFAVTQLCIFFVETQGNFLSLLLVNIIYNCFTLFVKILLTLGTSTDSMCTALTGYKEEH